MRPSGNSIKVFLNSSQEVLLAIDYFVVTIRTPEEIDCPPVCCICQGVCGSLPAPAEPAGRCGGGEEREDPGPPEAGGGGQGGGQAGSGAQGQEGGADGGAQEAQGGQGGQGEGGRPHREEEEVL